MKLEEIKELCQRGVLHLCKHHRTDRKRTIVKWNKDYTEIISKKVIEYPVNYYHAMYEDETNGYKINKKDYLLLEKELQNEPTNNSQ